MIKFRLSNEDLDVIDMIAAHYGYHRNSIAHLRLTGLPVSVIWAEFDKLTRPE